jgi:hypothetical protein
MSGAVSNVGHKAWSDSIIAQGMGRDKSLFLRDSVT